MLPKRLLFPSNRCFGANMEAVSVSTLARPLEAISKVFVPFAKQLHAERQAGRNFARVNTTLLDASFEETLDRLQHVATCDSWWRELLQRAQTAYVRPEYLEKPSIRAWLNEVSVRDDLKALARACLIPAETDGVAVKARLSERYAAHTGEAGVLAGGTID